MLPLFDAFPALGRSLPHEPFGAFPTPVGRLEGVSRKIGRDVFIKRDDLSGELYGGNKVRKLEFLLADAKQSGAVRVITTGAAGSNHACATALYAARLGLRATLVLSGQPPSRAVRDNLLMDFLSGAEMVYEEEYGAIDARIAALSEHYGRVEGRAPYLIPAGGSSPLGAVGYVNAAFELGAQVESGDIPEPAVLYLPAGTLGTAAGLLLGMKAVGLSGRLVAVRVVPAALANAERFSALYASVNELLRARDPSFPDLAAYAGDIVIDHDYFEPGYGLASRAVNEAVALAGKSDGLALDVTYSGKAFAALPAAARKNGDGSLLFWNTKNSRPVRGEAAAVDYRRLPGELYRYFETAGLSG